MKKRPYPYVEVSWVDAHSPQIGWGPPKDRIANAKRGFPIRSVGQLLHDGKKCVVLGLSRDATFGQIDQSLSIPRGCVKKVRRLR